MPMLFAGIWPKVLSNDVGVNSLRYPAVRGFKLLQIAVNSRRSRFFRFGH